MSTIHKKCGLIGAFCTVVLLSGCGNTLSGVKEDATQNTQGVRDAAHNAAAATKEDLNKAGTAVKQAGQDAAQATKDAAAAVTLTPLVKTAIIRDPVLNDTRNLVNVSVKGNAVHLEGHVATDSMKQRATEDAQKVLDDHKNTSPVQNDLTVAAAP